MKIKVLSASVLLLTLFIFSCKEESNTEPNQSQSSTTNSLSYLPNSPGSYWVYEVYRTDSANQSTLLGVDTMHVNDTIINGVRYSLYNYNLLPGVPRPTNFLFKDSSGIAVSFHGVIMLDINQTNTIVHYDTITPVMFFAYKIERPSSPVSVPNGTFSDIYNYKTIFSYDSSLTLPAGLPYQREWDKIYAKDVGIVYENFGYAGDPSLTLYERKLVDYYLAN